MGRQDCLLLTCTLHVPVSLPACMYSVGLYLLVNFFTLPYLMLVVSSSQIRFETRVGGYLMLLCCVLSCAELVQACAQLRRA